MLAWKVFRRDGDAEPANAAALKEELQRRLARLGGSPAKMSIALMWMSTAPCEGGKVIPQLGGRQAGTSQLVQQVGHVGECVQYLRGVYDATAAAKTGGGGAG